MQKNANANAEVMIGLGEFQHLVALMNHFGEDIVSGYLSSGAPCEVRMDFSVDGHVQTSKKRRVGKASSFPTLEQFSEIADIIWKVASCDGTGKVLSISNGFDDAGRPVIALSLCNHQEGNS